MEAVVLNTKQLWRSLLGKNRKASILKNRLVRYHRILRHYSRYIFRKFEVVHTILFHPLARVSIEISSQCNRKCSFCPNSKYVREIAYMKEELFQKIIDELKQMHFAGRLSFTLYNEPLLDKRLPKFVAYASRQLPAAYLFLNTNGDFLDISTWNALRTAGIHSFNISQYDDQLNDNLLQLSKILDKEERKHLRIKVKTLDVVRDTFTNRGGLVKAGKVIYSPLKEFCMRPFFHLPINYKGKAVICCDDYLGQVEIGDANHQNIADIWHSKKISSYRKKLFFRDRATLTLCNKCNKRAKFNNVSIRTKRIMELMHATQFCQGDSI